MGIPFYEYQAEFGLTKAWYNVVIRNDKAYVENINCNAAPRTSTQTKMIDTSLVAQYYNITDVIDIDDN